MKLMLMPMFARKKDYQQECRQVCLASSARLKREMQNTEVGSQKPE
jgi:hypothetical protein